MRRLLAVCFALTAAVAAEAQGPSSDWRTLETAHFRVHYPRDYETWAHRAASRLESIRDAVAREVGYDPPAPIDVLIANPIAQPNGLAWPLLDTPRIVFYTEPPGPDEQIGAYTNWIDLLAVHEVAHIVHLLRPSRNPLQRVIEQFLLPLNRISFDAPRWVIEGYATVIEGRLTGAGRPSSTMRALILRTWAANGRLPTYGQLDSDSRYLGMSMAYLMGSAYLEWLEQRKGASSLRDVWTRMTARHRRGFDEAFAGVFGESPERLYGQFAAELTASAVAANRAAPMHEGELWQETSRGSGDPAVSRDGKRIAMVIRSRSKPPALVVWSAGPPEAEEQRYAEQLQKIREADPEDVMPVRSKPLPRKPIHTLTAANGGDILLPRWMPDGRSILYGQRMPDAKGFLHLDLFLWAPEVGTVRRVTHLADVSEADPLPDGRRAIALRTRHGLSELVLVDLASGDVQSLSRPSIDAVYSHPRMHGDGRRAVYVANRDGVWSLETRDIVEDAIQPAAGARPRFSVPRPGEAFVAPEWIAGTDDIVVTILSRGFAELYRLTADGSRTPMTRTSGGAMQAAPAPDGRVFFMSLEPDGFVLRVIGSSEQTAEAPPVDETLVPALPPRPVPARAFEEQALAASRPYGIGRQEISWIAAQNLAPGQNATEAGIRIGDVVGRLDTIAVASFGSDDAQRGLAVASAWRGWPVEVSGHLFRSADRRHERSGIELRGIFDRRAPLGSFAVEAGVLAGEVDLAFVESRLRAFRVTRGWRTESQLQLGYESGSFTQKRGTLSVGVRRGDSSLTIEYERRLFEGEEIDHALETGGLPSSVIPRSAFIHRLLEPAVPVATLIGDDYDGQRVEATLPLLPLSLFYRRHRMNGTDLVVAGAEVTLSSGPFPVVRLPGADLTAGAARILRGPMASDTSWWLGLRWRP